MLEAVKPFFALETAENFNKDGIYLIGIPYDGTTSFRPGTRFGPDALREASYGLESYSPYQDKDLEDAPFFDMGNIPFQASRHDLLRESFFTLTQGLDLSKKKLLTVGGEHSISYCPAKLYLDYYKDLTIIHLDAHTDLREQYLDEPYSHACVVRRIVESMNSEQKLLQYGIRSGLKEEFTWMKENKTLATSLEELLTRIRNINGPIYVTLDLDFFDPAFFPGTGTPEAGGENFHNFISIIKELSKKNLVGADAVELSPVLDASGNSNVFAAKVVRELMLCLKN